MSVRRKVINFLCAVMGAALYISSTSPLRLYYNAHRVKREIASMDPEGNLSNIGDII
jgi:hypothetical protein